MHTNNGLFDKITSGLERTHLAALSIRQHKRSALGTRQLATGRPGTQHGASGKAEERHGGGEGVVGVVGLGVPAEDDGAIGELLVSHAGSLVADEDGGRELRRRGRER